MTDPGFPSPDPSPVLRQTRDELDALKAVLRELIDASAPYAPSIESIHAGDNRLAAARDAALVVLGGE